MANYVVEIGDGDGKSFKISLSVPFLAYMNGSWRTLDKGYIRYNSGATQVENSTGTLSSQHLYLYQSDNTWGIRLNDFRDISGANDEGTGIIVHPWVLNFSYGRISWALV